MGSSAATIDNHSITIDVHETPAQHSKLNCSEDDIPDLEDAPIITYVRTPVIMQPPSTDRKLVSPELVLEAASNSKDKTIKDTDVHTVHQESKKMQSKVPKSSLPKDPAQLYLKSRDELEIALENSREVLL